MKEIKRYVISYCEIPENLTSNHWIREYQNGCYVEYGLPKEEDWKAYEGASELDDWIVKTYPELMGQKFLIEMDY